MSDNNNTKPPVIKQTPEMIVEKRIKYFSDDMMNNEEGLAFIRIRDEVAERNVARLDESLARDKGSLARGEKSSARGRETSN